MEEKRAKLRGLGEQILDAVCADATPEEWAEWMRVPLEHALRLGNLGLVSDLVDAGASVNATRRPPRAGETPNGSFAKDKRPSVAERGERGCDGPLHFAVAMGKEPGVALLLSKGADPSAIGSNGRTPLHTAAEDGCSLAIVRFLLVAGADCSLRCHGSQCTALELASAKGHLDVVHELLKAGADVNAVCPHDALLGLHSFSERTQPDTGLSPLQCAAKHGHLAVVEALLAAGADASFRSASPPCHSALDLAVASRKVDIVQALIDSGADVRSANFHGSTALHEAAEFDAASSVAALVEAGADLEAETESGATPLLCSVSLNALSATAQLLKLGANINAQDKKDNTPLHKAAGIGGKNAEEMVELLLLWGDPDEDIENNQGLIPVETISPEYLCVCCCKAHDDHSLARELLELRPESRLWRRRGFLVLLRAFPERVHLRTPEPGKKASGGAASKGWGTGWLNKQLARTKRVARGERGERLAANARRKRADWNGAVTRTVGVREEGVFRRIVGYL